MLKESIYGGFRSCISSEIQSRTPLTEIDDDRSVPSKARHVRNETSPSHSCTTSNHWHLPCIVRNPDSCLLKERKKEKS